MNTDILNDNYYNEMMHNLNENLFPSIITNEQMNNHMVIHKILTTPTKEDKLKVFNYINWDDGSMDITIECYNDLFSYNIILDNMNKFVKLIENKRDSSDNMFYEFHREINIKVPDTIINLLLSENKMLGYNMLKQYIKTNERKYSCSYSC